MRAPGTLTLNTRVFAVFVRYRRTTSPRRASSASSGSPATSRTLPKRPIAAYEVSERLNGAIRPSSMSTSSSVSTHSRFTGAQ